MPRFAPRLLTLSVGAAAVVAISGCSPKEGNHVDLVRGKQMFVQKCGACHTLAHAGTTGAVGPNLDNAFREDVKENFGESAIRGVVRGQIKIPATGGKMPSGLVKGKLADDVAAYVASVVAQPGQDKGLLATVGQSPSTGGGGGGTAAGKQVFTSTCAGCHTLKDAGTSGTVGPNLDQLKPSDALVTKQVTDGGGGMPAFGKTLSKAQITAVAKYVSSVAGK